MTYFYEIAGIKLMFYGNSELDENGFSASFKALPSDPDKKLKLIKCRKAPVITKKINSDILGLTQLNGKNILISYSPHEKESKAFLVNDRFYFTEQIYTEGRFIWSYIDLPGILVENNRILLHCSYIIHNGEAILFCGKSGIGKSTQAGIWEKHKGAEIINGDKAVIYMNNGVPYVSSVPIAGTSGICKNKCAPLKAIVSLGQSKENTITGLKGIPALTKVFENCIFDNWRDGEADKCIGLISEIIGKIKVFDLQCLPDESAADILSDKLYGRDD